MQSSKIEPAIDFHVPATIAADSRAANQAVQDEVMGLFDERREELRTYTRPPIAPIALAWCARLARSGGSRI